MPSNTHTIIGGTKRFECRVVGHPRPEIRWFKDGRDITHSDRYNFDHTYEGVISMVMENISHRDQGNYRCRAENTEGFASTSAYLMVKAHREHPDEEIEEVHAMELEEHVVLKSSKDRSVLTQLIKDASRLDTARRRTFEDIVDEEKENCHGGMNGSVGKQASENGFSKQSSDITLVESSVSQQSKSSRTSTSSGKQIIESSMVEESIGKLSSESNTSKQSQSNVNKMTTESSTVESSVNKMSTESSINGNIEEQSSNKKSFSSYEETKESSSEYSMSVSTDTSSISSKTTTQSRSQDEALSVSASVDKSETQAEFGELEKIIEVSVDTQSSSRENQESGVSVTSSVDSDSSQTSGKHVLTMEDSKLEDRETAMVISEVSTEEISTERSMNAVDVSIEDISTESSRKAMGTERQVVVEVEVEEVAEECRMAPQGQAASGDSVVDVTDTAPSSLLHDSGFMESSLLDSSHCPPPDSLADSVLGSSIVDTSSIKTTQETTSVKTEAEETTAITSVEETSVKLETQEETKSTLNSTAVVQETSLVEQVTEENVAESETTTETHETKTEETSSVVESTQKTSHSEESVENIQGGDITGLLDETPDPATLVEDEVEAGEDLQDQRARWVDQITSKTETLTIEGEGKKVEPLKPDHETAVAVESQQAELSSATTQETPVVSVDTESLVARQSSVVGDLAFEQEQLATTSTQISTERTNRGFQEMLEVDEGMSAETVLGLQRQPRSAFDDMESSVDGPLEVVKDANSADSGEALAINAEVDTEESENVKESDENLTISTEVAVDESRTVQDAERELKITAEVNTEESEKVEDGKLEITSQVDAEQSEQIIEAAQKLDITSEADAEESRKLQEVNFKITSEVDVEESERERGDEGDVKARAATSVSDGETADSAGLSAPNIVSVSEDVTAELGQTIRLASQVQGNPQPEVKWFKEGDTVKSGQRVTLSTEDDVFTLEIDDAIASDAGTYTLTAHNSQGTIFSDVVVSVAIPTSLGPADEDIRVTATLNVPEFVAQPGNVMVKELGRLQLVCTIKASPSPNVVWSKDGQVMQSDSHVSVFESGDDYHLEVPRVAVDDAGDYVCTASNSEGSVTCTVSVFVESQETSASEEGAAAMVPLSQRESSSDVSTVDSATTRYLKLIAAAAAFSLAAFGVKKVVESLPK